MRRLKALRKLERLRKKVRDRAVLEAAQGVRTRDQAIQDIENFRKRSEAAQEELISWLFQTKANPHVFSYLARHREEQQRGLKQRALQISELDDEIARLEQQAYELVVRHRSTEQVLKKSEEARQKDLSRKEQREIDDLAQRGVKLS